MLDEIGIDQGTASRLMQISRNPAIANHGNCHDFPAAMRALYELSRMDPDDIERGIESGAITPACRAPVVACPGGPSRPLCEGRKSTTKLPLTFRNGLKNGERTRVRACQIEASAAMKKPPRSQCSCGMARVSGWCPLSDLNRRPKDYETHPLPSNGAG